MNSWLLKRQASLNIHGLPYTLDCLTKLMDFYGWNNWPGFYPVCLNRLPEEEMVTLLQDEEFLIYTSLGLSHGAEHGLADRVSTEWESDGLFERY